MSNVTIEYEAIFAPGSQAGKAATTTYRLYDAAGTAVGLASGVGVLETAPATYVASVTHDETFQGTIRWNTGGDNPAQASATINPHATIDVGNGDGDIAVTHNYGGADTWRVLDADDAPVNGATLRAYVKSDYDAGAIPAIVPSSITGSDGRWLRPLNLDANTYALTVLNPVTQITDVFELVVA